MKTAQRNHSAVMDAQEDVRKMRAAARELRKKIPLSRLKEYFEEIHEKSC